MDFLRARNAEIQLPLFRKAQVEAERVGKRSECGGTGAGGAELEELTTGKVAHVLTAFYSWHRSASSRTRAIVGRMNEFFSSLAKRWSDAARSRGATIDDPTLDAGVAEEILELARVVAHTTERRFAPLATSTAGVAAERLRASKGALAPGAAAAYLREVREALEREAPTP